MNERKRIPLCTGVLDYFPDALVEVARVSRAGNEKHNPGEPLHWSRGKSSDHPDALLRHLKDRGRLDPENGLRHSAEMAWRALAVLQEELEAAGEAPLARGATGTVSVSSVEWRRPFLAKSEPLGTCSYVPNFPHYYFPSCVNWKAT